MGSLAPLPEGSNEEAAVSVLPILNIKSLLDSLFGVENLPLHPCSLCNFGGIL